MSQGIPPDGSGASSVEDFAHGDRAQLVALAYLITGSRDEAEDVVQEVLLRLLRTDPGRIEDLGSYARRAVVNECASWGRRLSRRARGENALRAEAHRRHSGAPDPYRRVEIASALVGLPARHRSAIVLRYYLDWTDEAIAEALGCAPATVRSWLSRGLARLRTALEEPGDLP